MAACLCCRCLQTCLRACILGVGCGLALGRQVSVHSARTLSSTSRPQYYYQGCTRRGSPDDRGAGVTVSPPCRAGRDGVLQEHVRGRLDCPLQNWKSATMMVLRGRATSGGKTGKCSSLTGGSEALERLYLRSIGNFSFSPVKTSLSLRRIQFSPDQISTKALT